MLSPNLAPITPPSFEKVAYLLEDAIIATPWVFKVPSAFLHTLSKSVPTEGTLELTKSVARVPVCNTSPLNLDEPVLIAWESVTLYHLPLLFNTIWSPTTFTYLSEVLVLVIYEIQLETTSSLQRYKLKLFFFPPKLFSNAVQFVILSAAGLLLTQYLYFHQIYIFL